VYQIDLQISYRDSKLIFLQSHWNSATHPGSSKPRSSVELTHASHATAVAAVAAFLGAHWSTAVGYLFDILGVQMVSGKIEQEELVGHQF